MTTYRLALVDDQGGQTLVYTEHGEAPLRVALHLDGELDGITYGYNAVGKNPATAYGVSHAGIIAAISETISLANRERGIE